MNGHLLCNINNLLLQVRSMVDLLPEIDVVKDDPFNSDPNDFNAMGPDARERFKKGEKLPSVKAKTPLVSACVCLALPSSPCRDRRQTTTSQVELPLGATEDRICGTIDIEKALSEGIKAYEPGLLVRRLSITSGTSRAHINSFPASLVIRPTSTQAKANRGILYVDEVNLLDDGLVDVVLDSAASGINTVEREGISIVHPAKFIMIGSGNPQVSQEPKQVLPRPNFRKVAPQVEARLNTQEGELRPQLLDRFGMSVTVATLQDSALRTQMVLDRIAYEQDPDALCETARPAMVGRNDLLVFICPRII